MSTPSDTATPYTPTTRHPDPNTIDFGGTGPGEDSSSSSQIEFGNALFVATNGDDITGLRNRADKPFLTLTAAKAAALSGDTIFVYSGTYAENNLFKDGVNWHFHAGATVSYTDPGTGAGYGIFDDRATGAVTCKITGSGVFLWSGGIVGDTSNFDFRQNPNCIGTIVVKNASSNIQIECAEIGATSYDFASQNYAAVYAYKCAFFDLKVKRIYDPVGATTHEFIGTGDYDGIPIDPPTPSRISGIFWGAGETHIQCDVLDMPVRTYNIWCSEVAYGGVPSSFWYTGNYIGGKVYISGQSANWRTWIDVKWIDGRGSEAYYLISGGKHYLRAEKISTSGAHGAFINSATGATSGGNEVWLTVQKITSPALWISNGAVSGAGSPVTYADVQHLEDAGGVAVGVYVGSGILYLNNSNMKVLNGEAIKFEGGKGYIKNCIVDTANTNAAGNRPVEVTANGLHLMNSVLIAPALADSIYAATAKNVGILGSVMANKAKNANITTTPLGSFTVDSAVQ